MMEFICGLAIGICLSLVYLVALNLFKQHPAWSHFLDIKDHLADIKAKLNELLEKISHTKS
jgi:hypothetical protein